MADMGNIETQLSGLDDSERRIFKSIFQYLVKNIRLGRVVAGESSENFGGGFFSATTPGVANTEFSIKHSFGRTPYLVVPVLPLNQVNAQVVRLTNSRAADSQRVYFKSPDTSAPIFVYIEG